MAGASRSIAIPPKLRLLQAVDQRIGPALVGAFRPRAAGPRDAPVPADAVRRLLVLRPGGLGDAVLLRPMLDVLAAAYPAAAIDVLAERRNAGALAIGRPAFGVVLYDERPLAALRRLRAARYDLVVDTEQCHHFSVLAANALAPRWLCGFATLGRERFHTHAVPYSDERYEVESFLDLARAVTGRELAFDPERAFLAPDAASLAFADATLAAAAGRPVVAVLPAAGGSYRLWAPERYGAVARALVAGGAFVVVLGGADAIGAAATVCTGLPAGAALDLAGRTSLAQTAALLARSRLALGADSGVLHLAYAVGTPTLGLFGPALYRKWAPPGRRHGLVRLGLPCSPCVRLGRLPVCPIDVACMRDLGVERVLDALAALGVPAPTAAPFRDNPPASG